MNFRPILGRLSLIEDAMKAIRIDHVRSGNGDPVPWNRDRWIDEATRIGVVGPENDALRMLRNDLDNKVGTRLPRTGLKTVRRPDEGGVCRIQPEPNMVVTIWLQLEAVDSAADSPATIEHTQAARQVHARKGRTPLTLAGLKREFQQRNLHPEIGGHRQRAGH